MGAWVAVAVDITVVAAVVVAAATTVMVAAAVVLKVSDIATGDANIPNTTL